MFRKIIAPLTLAVAALSIAAAVVGIDEEGECSLDDGGSCEAQKNGSRRRQPKCADKEEECGTWAKAGECTNNPNYMLVNCPISCDSCPEPLDLPEEILDLLDRVSNYGPYQRVEGVDSEKTIDVVRKTVAYMENEIYGEDASHELSEEILEECVNKEELCSFWAAIGECEANKAYMKVKCAPSCQTCDMIDIDNRCPPLDESVRPGLLPGELNSMFERIVETAPGNQTGEVEIASGMTNYTVHVHSRPEPQIEKGQQPIISKAVDKEQAPWVITFENFLTEDECTHMIEQGRKAEYERSEDVGEVQADGSYDSVRSTGRTSENAWCSFRDGCRNDTIVELVHDRIAKVTGIGANHSEDFQILKYEPGQFYRQHHDYIEHQRDRRCGPRVLTFFLYLSDVEEGGATNFPKLGIAVKPKVGRALLWPSVLNSEPRNKDGRTDHEAQDVIAGVKYGANAWIHLHDYQAAQEEGCT
mmetsp:Transcript_23701/g.56124  ORF Transcript_23701/g.56124 Transcript_23701/m.56124 type:complete len:473 (-) Transcript_23701:1027-2445(-)